MAGQANAGQPDPHAVLPQIITAASQWCEAYQRPDLAARLASARRRARQGSAVVCVAGDFKQGKSSLVNALLGTELCPVDDTLATVAFTRIAMGPVNGLRVQRDTDGDTVIEDVDLDRLAHYADEAGNPGNREAVQLLEVSTQAPLLDAGVVLLDTPGVNALRAGNGAAVVAALDHMDALLFVSDALAELSEPEMDFLTQAQACGVEVLLALTKTDIAPAWRRMVDLDRGHLSTAHLSVEVFPVSAELWTQSQRRADPALADESGIRPLQDVIARTVLDPASDVALRWGLDQVGGCIDALTESLQAQRQALIDPQASRDTLTRLAAAQERQNALRSAGSRWNVLLNDGFGDLNQQIDDAIRAMVIAVREWAADELDQTDPAETWEPFAAELQARITKECGRVFQEVAANAEELAGSIRDLIDAETPFAVPTRQALDVDAVWSTSSRTPTKQKHGPITSLISAIRGGAGGTYLLGVVGGLAGIAVATPISIGVGTAFGVKQIVEERRTNLAQRRREARAIVDKFLADVQTRASTQLHRFARQTHRELRDQSSTQIEQSRAATAAAIQILQTSLQHEQTQREARARHIDAELARLKDLRTTIDTVAHRIDGQAAAGGEPA